MSVMVEFKGIERNPLKRFSARRASTVWAAEMGPLVVQAIKVKAPVSKKPGGGKLKESINYRHHAGYSTVALEFGSRVPYAKYVENGTAPHIITPRRASTLRWTDRTGNATYAQYVSHPGTKPNPFARNAVRAMTPLMLRRLAEITQAEFRSV